MGVALNGSWLDQLRKPQDESSSQEVRPTARTTDFAEIELAMERESKLLSERDESAFSWEENTKSDFVEEIASRVETWSVHDCLAVDGDLSVERDGRLLGVVKDRSE